MRKGTAYRSGVRGFTLGILVESVLLIVFNIRYCLLFVFIMLLCAKHCCMCLWVVHLSLPLQFSLTFISVIADKPKDRNHLDKF
jgi:hypothetical protein